MQRHMRFPSPPALLLALEVLAGRMTPERAINLLTDALRRPTAMTARMS